MNETYGTKLGNAVISVGSGIGWVIGVIVCTVVLFTCSMGKKVFEQGEKWAEKGQEKMAGKVAENFTEAGSNVKEAYNLYQQGEAEEEKVELPKDFFVDEGYHSGSEKAKEKLKV